MIKVVEQGPYTSLLRQNSTTCSIEFEHDHNFLQIQAYTYIPLLCKNLNVSFISFLDLQDGIIQELKI